MNIKKALGVTLCFCIAMMLYGLVRYQMNYADETEQIEQRDILHVLAGQKDLSKLVELINKAGLHSILEKAESVTLVAPTNDAFERLRTMLGDDAYNRIIHDRNQLQKILGHHIILNKESTDELSKDGALRTLSGTEISIKTSPQGILRIDDRATVIPVYSNIDAGTAFIHAIDEVILPDKFE